MRFALKLAAVAAVFTSAVALARGGHPCKQVESACSAAGYVKGEAKEGKGLFKNCVEPLLAGQAVPGVNVDPAAVQACAAKKAAKKGIPPPPPNGGEPPPKS